MIGVLELVFVGIDVVAVVGSNVVTLEAVGINYLVVTYFQEKHALWIIEVFDCFVVSFDDAVVDWAGGVELVGVMVISFDALRTNPSA